MIWLVLDALQYATTTLTMHQTEQVSVICYHPENCLHMEECSFNHFRYYWRTSDMNIQALKCSQYYASQWVSPWYGICLLSPHCCGICLCLKLRHRWCTGMSVTTSQDSWKLQICSDYLLQVKIGIILQNVAILFSLILLTKYINSRNNLSSVARNNIFSLYLDS